MATQHRRWASHDDLPRLPANRPLVLETLHSPPAPTAAEPVDFVASPSSLRVPPSPSLRLQTTNFAAPSVTAPALELVERPTSPAAAAAPPSVSPTGVSRPASRASPADTFSSPSPSSYSPAMDALSKMTPLPSPLVGTDSPGPWNKFRAAGGGSRTPSRKPSSTFHKRGESVLVTTSGETLDRAIAAQTQRKAYQGLRPEANGVLYPMNKPRHDLDFNNLMVPQGGRKVSNGHYPSGGERSPTGLEFDPIGSRMRREKCLAQRRRTISSAESSPAYMGGSTTSLSSVSSVDTPTTDAADANTRLIKKQKLESFEARSVGDGRVRRWRGIRLLGQGAFSKVILATSEDIPEEVDHVEDEGVVVEEESHPLDPRKLVAVKVVEHGAAGGASRERVESGLKRELDILKSVHHPCLVHLKAFSIEKSRALLVLNYCAGGDLFDVASDSDLNLSASLIRRMFAEIVSAVRYLHRSGIVHRDVKLENVLINVSRPELGHLSALPAAALAAHAYPVTTLTDVGLSRRVDFEHDDLLTTRCGSDDYASPELIMGQPYDGRATDAWALGVLLYALMEGRLPFDPPPGGSEQQKMRSRTAHRIARCEWKWYKLADGGGGGSGGGGGGDGQGQLDGVALAQPELDGGKHIVEGLLKRASKRWKLDTVEADEWVRDAITVKLAPGEYHDAPLV